MKELTDDEIPNVLALGRQVVQTDPKMQEAAKRFSESGNVLLSDPAKKKSRAE